MMSSFTRFMLLAGLVIILVTSSVHAADDIPPGTKITKANWEEYKEFMPPGMQGLFSGIYHWKLPDNVVMEVGEFKSIPPRKQYKKDTDKYAGQTTLKVFEESGAYIPEGYVAGLPFPDPQEPLKAIKIMYNAYYRDYPRLIHWPMHLRLEDKYGNRSESKGEVAYYKLAKMSEEGMPHTDPNRPTGALLSQYVTLTEPEQSKYVTQVAIIPDDPTRVEDAFAFIPSLRRSLRLSASSRCAPIVGSDWTPDDVRGFNGVPGFYNAEMIAERKYLMMVNAIPENLTHENFWDPPTWPKPIVGKWEVRPSYVINITRAAKVAAGYCYSKRLTYTDKETWANMWVESYDNGGNLWKIIPHFSAVYTFKNGEVLLPVEGMAVAAAYDVQNGHLTNTFEIPAFINEDAPSRFQNLKRYAYPEGLNEVMK